MFKLVVLLCGVCGLSAAAPGVGLVYGGSGLAYGGSGLAYGGVVPVSSVSQYSSSVLHGAPHAYSVYPGYAALAQAPHSPALVLDPVHGVPLDTPEVVAARAAHYQAKALSLHHLKKRSVVAPLAYSSPLVTGYSAYSSPVVSAYSSPVVSAYSSPVVSAYSSPLVSAYSSPLVSAYSSPVVSPYASPLVSGYSAPLVGSSLAYHGVGAKALSVHPW